MSFLFDQNLSRRLPGLIASEFPNSQQVFLIGMADADDLDVWKYAASQGLAIVSNDVDFKHLADIQGPPPKVIWLRIGNGPTSDVVNLLLDRAVEIRTFLSSDSASILELH